MNNDKPLDHEALLNSLCAIDQACQLARRQVQGLFPVLDICMNKGPNKFRPQDLKRKKTSLRKIDMRVVIIGQFQNSFRPDRK